MGRDPRFQGHGVYHQAQRGKKAKKPALPPVYTPVRAGLFGVDPGATAGYALVLPMPSTVTTYGKARTIRYTLVEGLYGETRKQRPELLERASAVCKEHDLPLMVAGEKWNAGNVRNDPTMTPAVLAGLGKAWGRWDLCREIAGVPASRVVRFFPHEWRGALWGKAGRRRGVKSTEWKDRAQKHVEAIFGVRVGPDCAEAICISLCGLHAGIVAAKTPKNRTG